MKTFLPLLLTLLATDPASPAGARALLAKVREVYTSSPSVSATFVQTYAPAGFAETSPETGTLVLQAPNLVRFQYDGKDGKLFTFDGGTARQYVAADKQMVVKSLTAEERGRLPLLFLETTESLLARYTATATPADNGLTALVLAPAAGGEPKRIELTVAADGEVKRLRIEDGSGNRTTFTFTGKTGGRARPATDFALVPPKGTRLITE